MSKEWKADYNTERPHKLLGYLSPVKFAEQHYKSTERVLQLYPQTANANTSPIEESCLVDKIIEKQKDDLLRKL